MAAVAEQPSNHRPLAPVVEPTHAVGIGASGGGGSDVACGVVAWRRVLLGAPGAAMVRA
jgi:hypothetical protein